MSGKICNACGKSFCDGTINTCSALKDKLQIVEKKNVINVMKVNPSLNFIQLIKTIINTKVYVRLVY